MGGDGVPPPASGATGSCSGRRPVGRAKLTDGRDHRSKCAAAESVDAGGCSKVGRHRHLTPEPLAR